MGIPYIQLDTDFVTSTAKLVSALLKVERHKAIGMAADLIAFAIAETSTKDSPPTGLFVDPDAGSILERAMDWEGEPGRAADAFERAGMLEKLEIGYRVRGTDRYRATWEKNNRRKTGRKPAGNRTETGDNAPGNRPLDGDGDGDVEGKKQKKQSGAEPFGLEQQDERTRPQRKPSEQQSFAAWFEGERKEALGAEWSEDVDLKGARLNKALDWIGREPEDALTRAARIYLADPYRRGQSPPCSLRWFAADRAEYLDKAKRQIRGAA